MAPFCHSRYLLAHRLPALEGSPPELSPGHFRKQLSLEYPGAPRAGAQSEKGMVPQKSEAEALILLSSLPSVFPPDRESGSEKVAVKHPHIPVFVSRLAHVPNFGILIRDSQKDAKTRPRWIVNARVHNLIIRKTLIKFAEILKISFGSIV